MKILKFIFLAILATISLSVFAQSLPGQTDEAKREEWREKIGLDLAIADFETNKISYNVMGPRLAGILDYLMENYHQGVYDRRLGQIASEQNDALENLYFQLKKLKFINAVKKGNEITITMRADLQNNAANIKQTDIVLHFDGGVSESYKVNELFSYISHYVQAREQLK